MPYYRGRGYGPDAWVLLIGGVGVAMCLAYALLRHLGAIG